MRAPDVGNPWTNFSTRRFIEHPEIGNDGLGYLPYLRVITYILGTRNPYMWRVKVCMVQGPYWMDLQLNNYLEDLNAQSATGIPAYESLAYYITFGRYFTLPYID